MYDPLRKISRIQNYFQQSFAAITRIYSLLDTHTEKKDRADAVELAPLKDRIELRGVSFKYHDSATGCSKMSTSRCAGAKWSRLSAFPGRANLR